MLACGILRACEWRMPSIAQGCRLLHRSASVQLKNDVVRLRFPPEGARGVEKRNGDKLRSESSEIARYTQVSGGLTVPDKRIHPEGKLPGSQRFTTYWCLMCTPFSARKEKTADFSFRGWRFALRMRKPRNGTRKSPCICAPGILR